MTGNRRQFLKKTLFSAAAGTAFLAGCGKQNNPGIAAPSDNNPESFGDNMAIYDRIQANELTLQDAAEAYAHLRSVITERLGDARNKNIPFYIIVADVHQNIDEKGYHPTELCRLYDIMVLDICRTLGIKTFFFETTPKYLGKIQQEIEGTDPKILYPIADAARLKGHKLLTTLIADAKQKGHDVVPVDGPEEIANRLRHLNLENTESLPSEAIDQLGYDTADQSSVFMAGAMTKTDATEKVVIKEGVLLTGKDHARKIYEELTARQTDVLIVNPAWIFPSPSLHPTVKENIKWVQDPANALQGPLKNLSARNAADIFDFAEKAIAYAKVMPTNIDNKQQGNGKSR